MSGSSKSKTTDIINTKTPESRDGGWHYLEGHLHCDGHSVKVVKDTLERQYVSQTHCVSPFYLYSEYLIKCNVTKYLEAFKKHAPHGELSYSLKANNNPGLLSVMKEVGLSRVTTVSGNEVLLALKHGILPSNIILNGNGKRIWELELAVTRGVVINVDSMFDAENIIQVSKKLNKSPQLLIRINPDIEALVHPFLSTGVVKSKFGVSENQLLEVLSLLHSNNMEVCGVHVHVGSTIQEVDVFKLVTESALYNLTQVQQHGWPQANILNLGGGLGINENAPLSKIHEKSDRIKSKQEIDETPQVMLFGQKDITNKIPEPEKLLEAISHVLTEDVKVILEPGRSIIASAGALITEVLGEKKSSRKNFIVVDAAMTEIIRPPLYGANHPVSPITWCTSKNPKIVDIVGPVCESSDFIQQDVVINYEVNKGSSLAVWNCGAYCSSMASNYNMRPRAMEVMVNTEGVKIINRPDEFKDVTRGYYGTHT